MTKNLKPCPKCKASCIMLAVDFAANGNGTHTYAIGCRGCGGILVGSTVRTLTAASKSSAWWRTKKKWNEMEREEAGK